MSDEDSGDECDCPPAGAPLWMATFADLMSLLMCFFVLLLSFAEMDIQKYKAVSGSMKDAFGVQRQIKFKQDPLGTSFIMKNFGPGTPTFTPLPMIQQKSQNNIKRVVIVREKGAANLSTEAEKDNQGQEVLGAMDEAQLQEALEDLLMEAAENQAQAMEADLHEVVAWRFAARSSLGSALCSADNPSENSVGCMSDNSSGEDSEDFETAHPIKSLVAFL